MIFYGDFPVFYALIKSGNIKGFIRELFNRRLNAACLTSPHNKHICFYKDTVSQGFMTSLFDIADGFSDTLSQPEVDWNISNNFRKISMKIRSAGAGHRENKSPPRTLKNTNK